MLPLYEDPCFTFRFAADRIIPRFHLEGVEAGRRASVFRIDPGSSERLEFLVTVTVGEDGWVDLCWKAEWCNRVPDPVNLENLGFPCPNPEAFEGSNLKLPKPFVPHN